MPYLLGLSHACVRVGRVRTPVRGRVRGRGVWAVRRVCRGDLRACPARVGSGHLRVQPVVGIV